MSESGTGGRSTFTRVALVAVAMAVGLGGCASDTSAPPSGASQRATQALVAHGAIVRPKVVHPNGEVLVRVLVSLKGDFVHEGGLSPEAIKAQREAIRLAQEKVVTAIGAHRGKPSKDYTARVLQAYTTVPGVALEVSEKEAAALALLPNVARVDEDALVAPDLTDTTGRLLTDARRANLAVQGPRGKGTAVAIIDTGVDRVHPFLGGSRFVDSACFSSDGWGAGDDGLCPSGDAAQVGGTAGDDCVGASNCDHGTHVAGIVGGFIDDDGVPGLSLGDRAGVAPEAELATIQVFHRENTADACGNDPVPCVRTNMGDVIAALDRVELLKTDLDINMVAANLSLGSGFYTDQDACDWDNWLAKWAIDDLRSQRIATVVSSGNSADSGPPTATFVAGVGSPACISSAVSVGNTNKSDFVVASSQTAPFLSLLAPGDSIESSVPGTGFALKSGTSMAAPHVAGAWAVLRERRAATGESQSVTAVLNRLVATGTSISDTRGGTTTTKARIDVARAVGLGAVTILGPDRLVVPSPADVVATYTFDRVNFDGPLTVQASVDGADAGDFTLTPSESPTSASSVRLTVAHALHVVGTHTLRVRGIANGVRVFSKDTVLTIATPQPTLTAFAPTSGPATTQVTLEGSQFSSLTRVFFGGAARIPAVGVVVLSPTRLRATVPQTATTGTILVENDATHRAASAASFVVTEVPVITSVSPQHAPIGTTITVQGTNFTGATATLSGLPVEALTIVSDTRLTFRIPVGATTGALRITAAGASDTETITVGYPVPTIASFAPQTGHAGQTVTLSGTGFFGSPLVRFGAVRASVVSVEPTRLRVTIPDGVPDSSHLVVLTAGGTATSTAAFQTDL